MQEMSGVTGVGQNQLRLVEVIKPGSNGHVKEIRIKIAEELLLDSGVKPSARAKHLLRKMPDHLFYVDENEIATIIFDNQEAKLFRDKDGTRIIVPWHIKLPQINSSKDGQT